MKEIKIKLPDEFTNVKYYEKGNIRYININYKHIKGRELKEEIISYSYK